MNNLNKLMLVNDYVRLQYKLPKFDHISSKLALRKSEKQLMNFEFIRSVAQI
jgi:hypothetical protein